MKTMKAMRREKQIYKNLEENQFGVYDTETFTLECSNKEFNHLDSKNASIKCSQRLPQGIQRIYYLLVYYPFHLMVNILIDRLPKINYHTQAIRRLK